MFSCLYFYVSVGEPSKLGSPWPLDRYHDDRRSVNGCSGCGTFYFYLLYLVSPHVILYSSAVKFSRSKSCFYQRNLDESHSIVAIYLGQDNAMCLQAAEFNSKIGPFDLV